MLIDIPKKLSKEIDAIITNYETSTINIAGEIKYSQAHTLKMVEFYTHSRYLKGQNDEQGRRKPFYNIVNKKVDEEVTSTDINLKDIKIVADNENFFVQSFILGKDIYDWAREMDFSKTLNEIGETRARYGGALVKRTHEDGKLFIDIVDWMNVITDQIDIKGGVIIERHYMTPTELQGKSGVWDNVNEAIELAQKKRMGNDVSDFRIEVLEIEGEFQEKLFDDSADDNEFSRKLFYIAKNNKDKVLLHEEDLKESRYKYIERKRRAGRGLGVGLVEQSEEAQIWMNDAVISEQSAMALAGKVIGKTNSSRVGNNLDTNIVNGQVFELTNDEFFETQSILPSALPEYQNLIDKWDRQASTRSLANETSPSATTFRGAALQAAQQSAVFDYLRQSLGFFIRDIVTDWVMPFVIKNNKDRNLQTELTATELEFVDNKFKESEKIRFQKENILDGNLITQEEIENVGQNSLEELQSTENRRTFTIKKDFFKDVIKHITVIITGEQRNIAAEVDNLQSILNTMLPEDPNRQTVMNKLLELSGAVSPVSLSGSIPTQATQQPIQDTGATRDVRSVLPQAIQ